MQRVQSSSACGQDHRKKLPMLRDKCEIKMNLKIGVVHRIHVHLVGSHQPQKFALAIVISKVHVFPVICRTYLQTLPQNELTATKSSE